MADDPTSVESVFFNGQPVPFSQGQIVRADQGWSLRLMTRERAPFIDVGSKGEVHVITEDRDDITFRGRCNLIIGEDPG